MSYYPISLDLTDAKCLVIGGGEVAVRKVTALAEAGARATVIAPEIDPRIEAISGVEIVRRGYDKGDLSGHVLIFAATDDTSLNAEIYREASEHGILVNSVDDPEHCSFIVPSVLRRGDLTIAVSTSGRSPGLSRKLRRELEEVFGPEYADYVRLLGEMRSKVKARYASQSDREAAFMRMLDGGILELLREGKADEARQRALECI